MYYGNRCAAFMMLEQYSKALEDAQRALHLDDNFVKVSHLAVGLQRYTGVPVHHNIFCHDTNIIYIYIEQTIAIFTIHLHMHQQTWESTVFN